MKEIDPTTQQIAQALGLKTEAGVRALNVALENIQLLDRKQLDYGSRNISDFGQIGVLVRCNDKVQRLTNLSKKGGKAANESVEDSWLDLANYAIIGYLVATGNWPTE